jgi:uncharacterized protein YdbL (DUF1318 family)
MNTTTTRRSVLSAAGVVALVGAFLAALAFAPSTVRADRAGELRDRFKNRFPQVRAAKQAGNIGETMAGVLEAVPGKSPDEATRKLMDEENADRRELYKLIAEREKTTAEKVAERNAARNFEKAVAGEYLKAADGKWTQKK